MSVNSAIHKNERAQDTYTGPVERVWPTMRDIVESSGVAEGPPDAQDDRQQGRRSMRLDSDGFKVLLEGRPSTLAQ